MNGTVLSVNEEPGAIWLVRVRHDDGAQRDYRWTAPELVRVMAAVRCSAVHFPGGRCTVQDGKVVAGRAEDALSDRLKGSGGEEFLNIRRAVQAIYRGDEGLGLFRAARHLAGQGPDDLPLLRER